MASAKVTFLSSRGRGICPDLGLVKDYLSQNMEKVELRYFINNELVKNHFVKRSVRLAKEKFCEEPTNIISVDVSLDGKMKLPVSDNSKIMLALPYGYQFEQAVKTKDKQDIPLRKTYKKYTHILAPSPFSYELFKKLYVWDDMELIDGVCSPLAWDINQHESQQKIFEQLKWYFPGIENKKILTIAVDGKVRQTHKEKYEEFDLRQFLEQLGEDWFVFTNCRELMQLSATLPARFTNSFAYIDRVFSTTKLMYVTDVLLTNSSLLASCFASKRKPLYCLEYNDANIEKYIKEEYPMFYLGSIGEILENKTAVDELSEEHKKFCQMLSYGTSVNPCEVIKNILEKE